MDWIGGMDWVIFLAMGWSNQLKGTPADETSATAPAGKTIVKVTRTSSVEEAFQTRSLRCVSPGWEAGQSDSYTIRVWKDKYFLMARIVNLLNQRIEHDTIKETPYA
jgi:hypothetical protein